MKFSEKLIWLRKREGLSQEELGYKLNVTRQTVSKWELGQTTPEMDKLSEISKIFNVSVDELINESDIEFKTNSNPIIEDQPIQEKSTKGNKIIFILIIVLVVIPILIIGGCVTGGYFLFNKAADQVLDIHGNMVNNVLSTSQGSTANKLLNSATGLIDSTMNSIQNSNTNNNEEMFNNLAEGFNKVTDIMNNNFNSETNEAVNQISVQAFNAPIEIYAGTSKKLFAVTVLDNIITSNKTNNRKITVKYNKTETQDEDKIRSIKQTINKADAFQDFEIICEYDVQGYMNKVIIEKV